MNYIVLEGFSLYLVLILNLVLVLISFSCLICVVFVDKRNFAMKRFIERLIIKNQLLLKSNFILKLKYGEFDVDEK